MTKRLTNKFIFVAKIFVIVVFVCSVILACFVKCTPKNIVSAKYYLVYASKSKNMALTKNIADEIEKRGGAGNIYVAGEIKFVIVSVYVSFEDSKQVLNNIQKEYGDCGIVELVCNRRTKLKGSQYKYVQNYCKLVEKLCDFLCECSINYDLNKTTISAIAKKIINYRQNILYYANDESVASFEIVKSSSALIVEYIDKFYSSVFISSAPSVYIKKLAVWCILELYEMNNLL